MWDAGKPKNRTAAPRQQRYFWNINHSYNGGARRRGADGVTMIAFDAAHAAVHYPPDRRFRIWIRPGVLAVALSAILLPLLAAWIEFISAGLPHIPPRPRVYAGDFASPHGFPVWERYCHFFNFVFVMMLIR